MASMPVEHATRIREHLRFLCRQEAPGHPEIGELPPPPERRVRLRSLHSRHIDREAVALTQAPEPDDLGGEVDEGRSCTGLEENGPRLRTHHDEALVTMDRDEERMRDIERRHEPVGVAA
jgi:hypothetical protein